MPLDPVVGLILKTGDQIVITAGDRIVEGFVKLASPNGRSLVIEYEAILYGFVGQMAVWQEDDGSYKNLLGGQPITIERQQ